MTEHPAESPLTPEEKQTHVQQYPSSSLNIPEHSEKIKSIQRQMGSFSNNELETFIQSALKEIPAVSFDSSSFFRANQENIRKQFELKKSQITNPDGTKNIELNRPMNWETFSKYLLNPVTVKTKKEYAEGKVVTTEQLNQIAKEQLQQATALIIEKYKQFIIDYAEEKKSRARDINYKNNIEGNLANFLKVDTNEILFNDFWKRKLFACVPGVEEYYEQFKLYSKGTSIKFNSASNLINREIVDAINSGKESKTLEFLNKMINDYPACMIGSGIAKKEVEEPSRSIIVVNFNRPLSPREPGSLGQGGEDKNSDKASPDTDGYQHKGKGTNVNQEMKETPSYLNEFPEHSDLSVKTLCNLASKNEKFVNDFSNIEIPEVPNSHLWENLDEFKGKTVEEASATALYKSLQSSVRIGKGDHNRLKILLDETANYPAEDSLWAVKGVGSTFSNSEEADKTVAEYTNKSIEEFVNDPEYFIDEYFINFVTDWMETQYLLQTRGVENAIKKYSPTSKIPSIAKSVINIGDYAIDALLQKTKIDKDYIFDYVLVKNKFNAAKEILMKIASGDIPFDPEKTADPAKTKQKAGLGKNVNIFLNSESVFEGVSKLVKTEQWVSKAINELKELDSNYLKRSPINNLEKAIYAQTSGKSYDEALGIYRKALGENLNNKLSASGKTQEDIKENLFTKISKKSGSKVIDSEKVNQLKNIIEGKETRFDKAYFEKIADFLEIDIEEIYARAPYFDANNQSDITNLASNYLPERSVKNVLGPILDAKRRESVKGQESTFSNANVNFFLSLMTLPSSFLGGGQSLPGKEYLPGIIYESTGGMSPRNKGEFEKLPESLEEKYPKGKQEFYEQEKPNKPLSSFNPPISPTRDTGEDYGKRILREKDPETGRIKLVPHYLEEDLSNYEQSLEGKIDAVSKAKLEFLRDPNITAQEKVNLLIRINEKGGKTPPNKDIEGKEIPSYIKEQEKYLKIWKDKNIQYSPEALEAAKEIQRIEEQEEAEKFNITSNNKRLSAFIKLAKNRMRMNA